MTVRVGILGNSFAKLIQLPALRWADANGGPNSVVALAGRNLAKAQATADEWSIPHATDAWETLFEPSSPAGSLDLVIISTPTDLHAPMVRAALKAGVSILCEKPFALNGDEARELEGEAAGRLALIDHQTRWSPWRRAFKDALASGMCGDLWAGRAQMRLGSVARATLPMTWWYEEERGGGVLGALGSHVIDGVLDQFGGPIASVTADLQTLVKERAGADGKPVKVTADDSATLWCTLENGLPVQIETDVLGFGCERDAGEGVLHEVRGSKGTLRLEGETELFFIPHGEPAQELPVTPLPTTEEMGISFDNVFPRCLPGYLVDILQAVAAGRNEVPGAATFTDAVHVMDVMDAARVSSREGRRVDVRV